MPRYIYELPEELPVVELVETGSACTAGATIRYQDLTYYVEANALSRREILCTIDVAMMGYKRKLATVVVPLTEDLAWNQVNPIATALVHQATRQVYEVPVLEKELEANSKKAAAAREAGKTLMEVIGGLSDALDLEDGNDDA